jgi:DNA helicase-2/ATP-dependent DNA helicase PcrA
MQPVPDVRVALANRQWIEHVLAQFTMSYTTLSKYLRCPLTFYYENILKVPFLKSDALAFGSAVHYALERMFKLMKDKQGVFPPLEEVIAAFNAELYREQESFTPVQYERRKEQGTQVLTEYYNAYIGSFATNVEIELRIARYMLDGVPVTGMIDKLELDGDNCTVVDYKTGDPDKSSSQYTAAPNDKDPNGGDYWRQMVFYKLLLENNPEKYRKVVRGLFDYIQKGTKTAAFKRIEIPFFESDELTVRQQLKTSYTGIMNHEFDKGCGKEDCQWCNFAKRYELIRAADEIEIDDV